MSDGENVPLLQASRTCINPGESETDEDMVQPAPRGGAGEAAAGLDQDTPTAAGPATTTVKLAPHTNLAMGGDQLPPPRSHPAAKGITGVCLCVCPTPPENLLSLTSHGPVPPSDVLDKLGLANAGDGDEIVRDLALYRDKRSGKIALCLIVTYIFIGSLFFAFYRGVCHGWV